MDELGSSRLVVLELESALLLVAEDECRDDGDDEGEEYGDVDVKNLDSVGDADADAEDEDEYEDGEVDDSAKVCAPVGIGVPFLPACRG